MPKRHGGVATVSALNTGAWLRAPVGADCSLCSSDIYDLYSEVYVCGCAPVWLDVRMAGAIVSMIRAFGRVVQPGGHRVTEWREADTLHGTGSPWLSGQTAVGSQTQWV